MTEVEIENRLANCALGGECGAFPAGTVFGDWRITAFIAKGGTAEVYCAVHAVLGTAAAVKVSAHIAFELLHVARCGGKGCEMAS